jgi:hypothetical protein
LPDLGVSFAPGAVFGAFPDVQKVCQPADGDFIALSLHLAVDLFREIDVHCVYPEKADLSP